MERWSIWMKRRRKYIGCSVELHNGRFRLRFKWEGRRYSRSTDLRDTRDGRARAERLAGLVAATIKAGRNPFELFQLAENVVKHEMLQHSVREYYDIWIADKEPPMVRRAQARDYRRHLERYVLPRLGRVSMSELSARDILGLRSELLRRGLSLKYVKNILGGSFKAMVRDAREIDGEVVHDPFAGVRWGRTPVQGPEPFSNDERQRIVTWFRDRLFRFDLEHRNGGGWMQPHPPYHAYVHTLFWTGMRPSEASALSWRDVDLDAGLVQVRRSRHLWEESAPKTAQASRTVELQPETVRMVSRLASGEVDREMHVFTNVRGGPIEPNSLLRHWYPCLEELGVRKRGLYATKDTYISTALTAGVNATWLEAQTGVRYETMRRHYGKWLRAEGANQLAKIAQLAPELTPEGLSCSEVAETRGELECERGDLNPHGCYPTGS